MRVGAVLPAERGGERDTGARQEDEVQAIKDNDGQRGADGGDEDGGDEVEETERGKGCCVHAVVEAGGGSAAVLLLEEGTAEAENDGHERELG